MENKTLYIIGGMFSLLLFIGMTVSAEDTPPISKGKIIMNGEIILGDRGDKIWYFEMDGSHPSIGGVATSYHNRNYEDFDSIAAGDVDGDGVDEVVMGDASDDDIHIYDVHSGSGDISSSEIRHFDVDFERYDDLAVGDINGDGRADIILGDASDPSGKSIRVFDLNGNEIAYFEVDGGFERYDRVASGDVDGDGIDEVILGDASDDYIHIFKYDAGLSNKLREINDFPAAGDDPTNEGHYSREDEVACGDVDGDGVEEILFGDGDRFHRIFIYTQDGNLLYDPIEAHFDSSDELTAGDVNQDGMDEIITGDASDDRIHIYDLYGNELDSFNVDYETADGLTVGDVDGDSVVVGEPTYKGEATITDQVIAVINAPPRDLSVIPDRNVFYAKYENEHGESTSMSVKAVTAVATSGRPDVFTTVSNLLHGKLTISKKITSKWEKTSGTTHEVEVGYGFTADARDYMVAVTTTYKVYEYPIIKPDELNGETMLIMVPVQGPIPSTLPYDSPVHTYGFLLTYPSQPRDLLNYDRNNEIQGFAHGMPIGPDSQWTWIRMSESSFNEEKRSNSITLTSKKISIIGTLGVSTEKYSRDRIETHKVEFTDQTSIHVYYAGGITDEDKYYRVTPVVYYDSEDGHLVLDYLVSNIGGYYFANLDFVGSLIGGSLFSIGEGSTDNSSIPSGLADMYQNQYGRNIFGSGVFGSSGSTTSTDQTVLFTESRSMLPNETIEVPIQMINARNIRNMDLIVRYNSSVLSATSAVTGSFTSDALFESNIMDGEIRIAFVDTNGFSGNGSVAVITFNVIGNPGDYTTLILEASANDIDDNDVDFNIINGVFTVDNPNATLKGDCNGDGKISSIDALMALQMYVGKMEKNLVGDMNDDGEITSLDAAKILEAGVEDQADKTDLLLRGYTKGIKYNIGIGIGG